MTMAAAEFYRLDPLTGCSNFLSFIETLDHLSSQEIRQGFSILYLDLRDLSRLNSIKGYAYGDSVIRWLGIVLQEESCSSTYRLGGDDFAVVLTVGTHVEHEELLKRLSVRLNREGGQLGIPTPPAAIALIHFGAEQIFSIHDAMFHLGETMRDVRLNQERTISIFHACDLMQSTAKVNEEEQQTHNQSWEVLRFIANQSISRVLSIGRMLDAAQKTSYIDSISGLPNLRAALVTMDKAIHNASLSNQSFSILLTDGDDFRKYNSISYVAGDEVIQNTGKILSESLRPEDFVARWRTGDEFIVILPNTSSEGAKTVGERFRCAVKETSRTWVHPSSISIGVASYPKHGKNTTELVDRAEAALKRAKEEGKDRLVLAE